MNVNTLDSFFSKHRLVKMVVQISSIVIALFGCLKGLSYFGFHNTLYRVHGLFHKLGFKYKKIDEEKYYLGEFERVLPVAAKVSSHVTEILYVLHFDPLEVKNGYSSRTRDIIRLLNDLKKNVDIAVIHDNAKHVVWYVCEGSESCLDKLPRKRFCSLKSIFRNKKYDLVIGASPGVVAFKACVESYLVGIPFIYDMRGIWSLTRALRAPWFQRTSRFQFELQLECELIRMSNHVLTHNIEVINYLIPNKLDVDSVTEVCNWSERMHSNDASTSQVSDTGLVTIGYMGAIEKYEGVQDLLEAFVKFASKHQGDSFRLIFAGSGSYRKKLMAIASKSSFQIELVQYMSPSVFYSCVDLVVIPRRSNVLTELITPYKFSEAMFNAKSLLVTDLKPFKRFFTGRVGCVRAGDVASLERSLELCLQSKVRTWERREVPEKLSKSFALKAFQSILKKL